MVTQLIAASSCAADIAVSISGYDNERRCPSDYLLNVIRLAFAAPSARVAGLVRDISVRSLTPTSCNHHSSR